MLELRFELRFPDFHSRHQARSQVNECSVVNKGDHKATPSQIMVHPVQRGRHLRHAHGSGVLPLHHSSFLIKERTYSNP